MDFTEHSVRSEQVYDGALLDVRRDEVRLPNGETSAREWIKHPGASAVVPVDGEGRVILLRQYRFGPGREFWEVPAGKFDEDGEDALAVARRELAEEAGVAAERWTPLGQTFPAIGYSDETIWLFLAEGLSATDDHADDDEFVEPFRVPFEEAVAMARRGEIEDAKSCVALLLAAAAIDRRTGESG
ncbi:NUDIX domain-containing protein [Rubrivirga sp.]|uniref:NUDIX domain-containing protein n=1 Tax=Rubrivirga sp. TaxID=1885344 RepID=UPI003B528A1E